MAAKPPDRSELEERRATLQHRLTDGYQRIANAEQAGADIAAWEVFWFKLLHEYEATCREIDALSVSSSRDPQSPRKEQPASLVSGGGN